MKTYKVTDRLILFEALQKDEICIRLSELLIDIDNNEAAALDTSTYYEIQRGLVGCIGNGSISGNYLQDHLCKIIATEDNIFARMSEQGVFERAISGPERASNASILSEEAFHLLNLAAREIGLLAPLYRFDFKKVFKNLNEYSISNIAGTEIPTRARSCASECALSLQPIHEAMNEEDAMDAAILLATYYRKYGCGVFGISQALMADKNGLIPQNKIDAVFMEDIVGNENQKRALLENTEILLSGHRANNILLYGDSGTGKSSSVKALMTYYAGKGLKLIFVAKDKLDILPEIYERIDGRGMKFIIFIDDLSFEENEYEFKAFKSIIEGRIAPRPDNAVFIVTTNRKNIVKDSWSDREGQDDVRRRDNMEEKRSLADRFGITLIYTAPDKIEYLAIVRSIADKAGLTMEDDELFSEALKWEIRHGGRSGRTARQFVDYMVGKYTMFNEGEH